MGYPGRYYEPTPVRTLCDNCERHFDELCEHDHCATCARDAECCHFFCRAEGCDETQILCKHNYCTDHREDCSGCAREIEQRHEARHDVRDRDVWIADQRRALQRDDELTGGAL